VTHLAVLDPLPLVLAPPLQPLLLILKLVLLVLALGVDVLEPAPVGVVLGGELGGAFEKEEEKSGGGGEQEVVRWGGVGGGGWEAGVQ
jgi:hypothetical protein